MKNSIATKASRLISTASLKLKKHSPEILVVAGIAGAAVSTVMACKATLKVDEIIKEKEEKMNEIETCLNSEEYDYNEEDKKKDTTIVYTQTGLRLLKLYGPALGIGVLSITSILAGTHILRKRNVALAAAYTVVDKGFKNYRNNVVERFGEQVDKELRYNIKAREIEKESTDKNGKKKTTKQIVQTIDGGEPISEYARFFDELSSAYEKDSEYNLMFLRRQQDYANEVLKSKGYLFLNEVYDMLGIPRTKAGQIVGWIYNEKNPIGDNYVDFNIYNGSEASHLFVNGYERSILLDFNVDGPILDLI